MKDELNEPMPAILTRPLFAMRLTVDAIFDIGGPQGAERRVGPISAGLFEGERLRGEACPGADWQTQRSDGALELDARLVLKTHDNAILAMSFTGIRHGPPDVMARLGRGEEVDPSSYYFRIAPRFQTSDRRYEWLNRIVSIGVGHRLPKGPVYFVHEIL